MAGEIAAPAGAGDVRVIAPVAAAPPARKSSGGPLRVALGQSEFRRLVGALAVSQAGDWLYNVGLLVYLFDRTHSTAWVAAGTVVRLLPITLLGPLAGAIADRYDRRTVMVASDISRSVCMGLLALVAASSLSPAFALALAFLSTMAGAPYRPAVAATTPNIVAEGDLSAANAAIEAIANIAIILGPAVGGLLLAVGPPPIGFGVNAVSFLLAGLAVSTMRAHGRSQPRAEGSSFLREIAEGLRAMANSGGALVIMLLEFAGAFVYGEMTVLLVLASEQRLGTGSQGYGYLLGALGFGGVLMVSVASRLAARSSITVPLAVGYLVGSAPLAALAVVERPAIAYAILVFAGMGAIVVDVLTVTFLQRTLPREVLGRVFGVFDSLLIAAILLGALLAPLLVAVVGLRAAIVVAFVVIPTPLLLALPATRGLASAAAERLREVAPALDLLTRLGIFEGTSRQSLELLASSAVELPVSAGDVVIRQGEPARHLFAVCSGTLDVLFARSESETPAVVNTLTEGDYFGEIGLLQGIPRTATVRASSDGVLLRIEGDDFLNVINQAPAVSGTLLRGMSSRLARTHPGQPVLAGLVPTTTDD